MKYPTKHLVFNIPVEIGLGTVDVDDDGRVRIELRSPEGYLVVREVLYPESPPAPEVDGKHAPGCCTASDGTWSESQECHAECWCHTPVPEVTPEDIARAMEIPEEVVYDPRAAGTVYPTVRSQHGAQEYIEQTLTTSVFGQPTALRCKGCGALVGDKAQHDYAHSKGRSIV